MRTISLRGVARDAANSHVNDLLIPHQDSLCLLFFCKIATSRRRCSTNVAFGMGGRLRDQSGSADEEIQSNRRNDVHSGEPQCRL